MGGFQDSVTATLPRPHLNSGALRVVALAFGVAAIILVAYHVFQ
jgi:hypothetical protein